MAGPTNVDLAQVVNQQAQLEEIVGTNHVVHTIKQLLDRMIIPLAQPTTGGRPAVEGLRVEQQVNKATTGGNMTSTHRTNSQQVTRSQAKSSHLATTTKRKHDEAGTSRPRNKIDLGCPTR